MDASVWEGMKRFFGMEPNGRDFPLGTGPVDAKRMIRAAISETRP